MALDLAGSPAERRETLLDLYRMLVTIRHFERRTGELFAAGEIKGTAHSSIGQEAIAAGVGSVLRADDYVAGHHRSHGHLIAKGGDVTRMFAELMGRETGYCRGVGGSMHIADPALGILGCNGVVGAGLGLACGSALASRLAGNDRVSVVYFGDGANGEGITHEALTLAAVWNLPVLFVCENNQFALTTEWREARPVERIAERAVAYGLRGITVDGNDVLAVRALARECVDALRAGGAPVLVEAVTYRWMEHSLRANLPETRDLEERQRWIDERDPLARYAAALREWGIATAELEALHEDAVRDVEAAIVAARGADTLAPAALTTMVYAPAQPDPPPPPVSSRRVSFITGVREALAGEMERDPRVVVIGEDVRMGGIFTATQGLLERFGAERVRNTPIAEAGFATLAVGAAMSGLRPVVEVQIFDFVTLMMDAIVNQAAKFRFMMGGTVPIPIVVRGPAGGGVRLAAQHSQSLEAWFAHVPGLIVVAPSNARDAKGLLAAAIRDDNPVVFIETKSLLFSEAACPEESFAIALGRAEVKREGKDVTVVATQAMVAQALRAAQELERDGISLEVVDPRTIQPLDEATILASVRKTGRAVVAHEAVRFGGIGGEIAATIAEKAFFDLDAPVARVGAPFHPVPYEDSLERATLPDWRSIVEAVRAMP